MIRIGAVLPPDLPPKEIISFVQELDLVADSVWIWDDLGFSGGISQTSIALTATQKMTVGLGITPVAFRHPASAAMEFSTLAQAFPNRFIAGLGHGVQHWMEQLGERVESPLPKLKETHEVISALLGGGTISIDGQHFSYTNVSLRKPPKPSPPIYIGARGPETIKYAGQSADGMITAEWTSPAVLKDVRKQLRTDQPLVAYVAYDNPKPHQIEKELTRHLNHIKDRSDVARTVASGKLPDELNIDDITSASAIGGLDELEQTAKEFAESGVTEIVLVAQSPSALSYLPSALEELKHRFRHTTP